MDRRSTSLRHLICLRYSVALIVIIKGSFASIDESTLSPQCRTLGICDEVSNYPESIASLLIKELKNNNTKFNEDKIFEILPRFRDGTLDVPLCESKKVLFIPRAGQSKNGTWHYILNTINEPVQKYHVEICKPMGNNRRSMKREAEDNGRCSKLAYFGKHHEGMCIQKYILREMIAVSVSNRSTFIDHFHIPSCCTCVETNKQKF